MQRLHKGKRTKWKRFQKMQRHRQLANMGSKERKEARRRDSRENGRFVFASQNSEDAIWGRLRVQKQTAVLVSVVSNKACNKEPKVPACWRNFCARTENLSTCSAMYEASLMAASASASACNCIKSAKMDNWSVESELNSTYFSARYISAVERD